MAVLRDTAGTRGLFTDGDWILSENMDANGEYGVIQLKHVGIGEFINKDFKFITRRKFSELKCTEVLPGDVLISRMADPIGRACIAPNLGFQCVTAVDVTILRVDKNIANPSYVKHLCNSNIVKQQVERVYRGTTRARITRTELGILEIPLPPLSEQQRIAAILDKADRLRRLRRTARQIGDSYLQSVFMEMFGDPVRNPMGWEVDTLGKHTTLISSGSTPLGGSAVYENQGVRFIRSQNVLMNSFDFSDIAYINQNIHREMKRTHVASNDVLLNITGASIGRVACYQEARNANVNQHVCIIRCKKQDINPIFLSYLIASNSFQRKIFSTQSGATRQALTFDQIAKFVVIKPPIDLQNNFANLVAQYDGLCAQQREAERQAEHLFQSLLQRAFEGEL